MQFLSGNLVYKVETNEIGDDFLFLFSLFITSITDLFFCICQKLLTLLKNLYLLLYVCIYLKSKQKIGVTVLVMFYI